MRPRTVRRALIPTLLILASAAISTAPAAAFERLAQYGIGIPGSGNGQVGVSMGVAVAPDGTVVASDIAGNRIVVFDQSGRFLRAFGKDVAQGGADGPEVCVTDCKQGVSGSAAGELTSPWGVATSATEVYVAETGNHRVSVFDFEGRFLRAFGSDVGGPGVNVCSMTCGPGTAGFEAGQLAGPAGMALDASGKLLVGELGTRRVDVFDPVSGQFLLAFGKDVGGPGVSTCTTICAIGSGGPEPGSLVEAASLAVSPGGEIFITDSENDRVSVFGADGGFRRQLGSPGSASGQLEQPHGVAVDGSGVFVTDLQNQRLALFGEAGDFRSALGFDVIPGLPAGAEVCTTLCQAAGALDLGIGSFPEPRGIATDCQGAVYVGMLGRIEKWGEPDQPAPPCPVASAAASPGPSPSSAPVVASNEFSIGRPRLDRKKGIATLAVTVPGAGNLVAATAKRMKATAPQPATAGTVRVTVRATGGGVKALARKGALEGTLTLTYTPTGGAPNTKSQRIQLSKKPKKKKRVKPGKAKAGKSTAGRGD